MAKAHLAFWPGELKKNKCIVFAIKNLNFCPYPTLRAFSAAVKSHIYFFWLDIIIYLVLDLNMLEIFAAGR